MIKCPKCGHENPEHTKICDICGTLLINPSVTRRYTDTDYEEGDPRWGSARFRGMLILDVVETNQRFEFDASEIEEIIIGREDTVDDLMPVVDLTSSHGLEKGVSRRHALIVQREGTLHIVDNSSSNGTFLNGQRLIANQPRILRDGDDIRLGHLILRVTFQQTMS